MDDIFCKIIKGEIPTEFLYQDEDLIVFKDINPKAPVHLLIVPKKHISSVNEVVNEDQMLLGKMFLTAKKLAQDFGVAESGYRLMVNNGSGSGQIVFHLHMHLLGGKTMKGE